MKIAVGSRNGRRDHVESFSRKKLPSNRIIPVASERSVGKEIDFRSKIYGCGL
jgi:hypothetical protein